MQIDLDFTNLTLAAKIYDFESGKEIPEAPADGEGFAISIRPYPASLSNLLVKDDGVVISGEEQLKVFDYCVVAFHNLFDSNGKEIKATKANKKVIYDRQVSGIPQFVIGKSRLFDREKETQEKN